MKKNSLRSTALLPLILLACGGGVAAPVPDLFGFDPPPNPYQQPTNGWQPADNAYEDPNEPPTNQGRDAGTQKFDASLPDTSVKVDVFVPPTEVCYSPCSGTLTCTPETGSGSPATYTLSKSGKDCTGADDTSAVASTVSLLCDGTATYEASSSGQTFGPYEGTWTKSASGMRVCFMLDGQESCATCE